MPPWEPTSATTKQPTTKSALDTGIEKGEGMPGTDIGGEGGSRAWVGKVRRKSRAKRVVRADGENGGLRQFRCSAVDDKIEVL